MTLQTQTNRHHSALYVLVILQLTMLGALFTSTPPHPPLAIPLFGLGPFLGTSIAIAIVAIRESMDTKTGFSLSLLAALMALISFGPQKWFDPTIATIWPAVLAGEVAALVIIITCVKSLLNRSPDKARA